REDVARRQKLPNPLPDKPLRPRRIQPAHALPTLPRPLIRCCPPWKIHRAQIVISDHSPSKFSQPSLHRPSVQNGKASAPVDLCRHRCVDSSAPHSSPPSIPFPLCPACNLIQWNLQARAQ